VGFWPEKVGRRKNSGDFEDFGRTFTDDFLNFWTFFAHFAHFFLKLTRHFGQQKPSIYAGLRAVCPLSHFFLQTIMIKNFNNIINRARKSGHLTKVRKRRFL